MKSIGLEKTFVYITGSRRIVTNC